MGHQPIIIDPGVKTSVPDSHVVSPARLLLLCRDFFDDLSSADVVSSHTCASTLCAALPPKPLVGFYFWEVDDGEEVLSEDGVFNTVHTVQAVSGEKTSSGKIR